MASTNGGSNLLGARMMRQNTNQRKQAMSDIEASVTKLLIATKQLLESLTQWSRLEATENDVSDIYVNLGNEFNRATISFQNAGIDMSDLENTPNELRHILERALGEDASVVNLDKFLPRIREIIINLLQGLKRKQQIHRIQNGEAAAPPRLRRMESPAPSLAASRSQDDMQRQRSASPSINSVTSTPTPQGQNGHAATNYSTAKRQLPSIPMPQTSPSQIQPPRKAPEPPTVSRDLFHPAPAIPSSSDPVTQLSQMTLERRSSKRFSENYLAQLTSSPNGDRSGKLSVNDVRKHLQKTVAIPEAIEDDAAEAADYSASRAYGVPVVQSSSDAQLAPKSPSLPSPIYKTIETPVPRSPDLRQLPKFNESVKQVNGTSKASNRETIILFFKKADQTKKATFEGELTMDKIRESLEAIYGPLNDDVLHVEDAESKVFYELEDIADVKQRSIILVKPSKSATTDIVPRSTQIDSQDLRAWLDERLEQLKRDIAQIQPDSTTSGSKEPLRPNSIEKDATDSTIATSAQTATRTKSPSGSEQNLPASEALEALQAETDRLRIELANAQKALADAATAEPPSIVVSANRDHVMSMSAKHEHRGTELTAKLEEAMNTMERIRKDVLQRKVTPRPQQLEDLSREFEEIEKESIALAENLVLLDASSNKLWEEELTIITSEQDALEYQRAFIDDIKADLEQSLSSLSTIKQVEEQKRVGGVSAVPMILETSTDPSRAIKFVQADIKSLQINHERRAEAIADAEKQRVKEREYLMENEFKKELGAFVGSNNLKNTGGAAEIERLRAEKDDAHRKAIFSKPNESKDDIQVMPQAEKGSGEAATDDGEAIEEVATIPGLEGEAETETDVSIASEQPKVASGSASILAKIDASRGFDALERRRSSLMKHAPSNESLSLRGKQDQGDAQVIREEALELETGGASDNN